MIPGMYATQIYFVFQYGYTRTARRPSYIGTRHMNQDDGYMENRRMIVQADGMRRGEMEVRWTVDLGLSQATPRAYARSFRQRANKSPPGGVACRWGHRGIGTVRKSGSRYLRHILKYTGYLILLYEVESYLEGRDTAR